MNGRVHRPRGTVAAIVFLGALAGSVNAGTTPVSWAAPVDGLWSNAANWSPAVVPGISDDVFLGLSGAYIVQLGTATRDAASLSVENPLVQFHLATSRSLRVQGDVINHGSIVLNPGNVLRTPRLILTDGATISGTGSIRLNAPDFFAELGGFLTTDTVVHESPHTIAGMGTLSLGLTNRSAVIADAPGERLRLTAASHLNEGLVSATNGGILRISGVVTQTAAGSVLADGSGSTVELLADQFSGGSLGSVNGGAIQLLNPIGTTIESTRLHGDVRIPAGTTTTLNAVQVDAADLSIDPPDPVATVIAIGSQSQWSSGSLALTQPLHRLETAPGTEGVVLGPDLLLSGVGILRLNAANQATIRADQPGQSLQVQVSTLEHHGTIEAVNGATMSVSDSTVDRRPGSVLRADGPGSVLRIAATNTGGEIPITNGARLELGRTNNDSVMTLQQPVLSGEVTLLSGTNVTVIGPFVNNAAMRLMPPLSNNRFTRLLLADGTLIDGTGTIELSEFGSEIAPQTPGAVVTLGTGQTLTGVGRVRTGMIIEGTVLTGPGDLLNFAGPTVVSRSIMIVTGGRLQFGGPLTQDIGSGLVVEDGGELWIARGDPYDGRVIGGTIDVRDDGKLIISNAGLVGVTVNGDTHFFQGINRLSLANSFVNNGTVLLNGSGFLFFENSMTVSGSGVISLGNRVTGGMSSAPGVEVTFGPTQRIEGPGTMTVPSIVQGTIAPGHGIGTLSADPSLTLAPTSVLEIEIGPTSVDHMWSRQAHLDGRLELHFVDGFAPSGPYWDRLFMTAINSHTGSFRQVSGPPLADPRLEYRVTYANTQFRVGTFCQADVNGDRQLNFFDLSAFIALFNAQDQAADIAAPFGTLNFFDIAAYISRFNAGCP